MRPEPAAADATRQPELGLALSGGGFRAAFFHLGVLARMAEVGLLRRVEVISTVSGGSIIGAVYYLHVKDLLESRAAADVRDEDYLRIVEHMQKTFLAGVQTHVRARAYASLRLNFAMARSDYSRSDRIGDIYGETFYGPTWDRPLFAAEPAPRNREQIEMRELRIQPPGVPADFSPLRAPPREEAPVPILLVNATSLNSGHNWRFEAVRMGEDPRTRRRWIEIDKNKRFQTVRWEQLPPHQQNFELGRAVAASACVPGLFQPLAVSGLFRYRVPGRGGVHDVRVELVDGGVHDNQGVCGLIDTECQRMIISDASGQMGDLDEPPTRIPASVSRATTGVFGDRVREEQLVGALQREAVALMHLKKGLQAFVVPPLPAPDAAPVEAEPLDDVDYGVHRAVQERLSGVRTDLDSFTEIEAFSLARFGYAMAEKELAAPGIRELWRERSLSGTWDFDAVREVMKRPDEAYLRHLEVSQKRFFKALALNSRLKMAAVALGILVLALVAAGLYFGRAVFSAEVPVTGVLVVAAAIAALLVLYLKKLKSPRLRGVAELVYSTLGPVVAAPGVWAAARAMLALNGAFVRAGEARRLRDG
ncbi:MAG TPA: patatin-like phospholipase family protein [Gaiellaceae bacterium]|nr:patatin-like phospholipase family protein [Gaiellaceae bacterium]